MSKKKFKAGLESLFGAPAVAGMSPFLVDEEEKKEMASIKKAQKRSTSKDFTSDLDSLFSDAIDKEHEEQSYKYNSHAKGNTMERKHRLDKPVVGLDALIRRTIEEKTDDVTARAALKKRITITLENQKLEKLKAIARMKKSYLRDIIDDIVSAFLKEYKKSNNAEN